jgi:hypothetical protein
MYLIWLPNFLPVPHSVSKEIYDNPEKYAEDQFWCICLEKVDLDEFINRKKSFLRQLIQRYDKDLAISQLQPLIIERIIVTTVQSLCYFRPGNLSKEEKMRLFVKRIKKSNDTIFDKITSISDVLRGFTSETKFENIRNTIYSIILPGSLYRAVMKEELLKLNCLKSIAEEAISELEK